MAASDEALNCQELVELVTEYLDGALPAPDRDRFEGHVATCPNCERYLRQMRFTITTMGRLTERDIAPSARDQLLLLFRNWKREPGSANS